MNGLIKSGSLADLSAVRPLAALASASVVPLSKAEEERRGLLRRVATLEKDVSQRDETIGDLRAAAERSFTEGQEQGRTMGLAEAEDRQSLRLLLLEAAMKQARAEMSAGLLSLERLSALLARECLDMILGNPNDRVDILCDIVKAQIGRIDKAMLLGIELSRQDFPDDEALAALAARVGLSSITLAANADMPSGGCVMTLRLGSMDIGINQQWGKLREALDRIAFPEEAS